jgi:hypothetical protein
MTRRQPLTYLLLRLFFKINSLCTHFFIHPILNPVDEGSVQRVVKNRHDRAWDTIRDIVSKVRNSMNTKNWSAVEDAWKECNKKMETSKKDVLAKGIPPFYIRMLVDVEDAVNALSKEQLRALKPAIGKAAASLKTASKKHNVAYATDMAACRADPSKYESASESESEEEDQEEADDDVSMRPILPFF